MWWKTLITSAAAAALSLAVTIGADAQSVGVNAGVNAGAGVNTSAGVHARTQTGFNARASVRGPRSTPPGWRHGRKTGWHGGTRPPGLR